MIDKPTSEVPVFVESVLESAIEHGASDIYWLPDKDHYTVRYRIDGIQKTIYTIPRDYGIQCVSRIKVLAKLLTYRNEIAQDGVIRDVVPAELRVAVMPTIHGERATIRLFGNTQELRHLDELGFTENVVSKLRDMLLHRHGMIVLTGPTGCGKTTTIYAMVRELLDNDQDPASIITIEDPVECEIPGISQVSVTRANEEWGYAQALRSSLRQDVKTLVIGEMRDKEVVRVALDASLTGHRVITTFHAGDIPSVYARMLHLGFEPFLVAAAVTGVVSQRLVNHEQNTRVPVVACLRPDDAWRDFITANPGLGDLRRKVTEYPAANLSEIALKMAEAGVISEMEAHLI